ncbi:MAG: hypothetical protein KKA84_07260 [Bacteroidetes bacterium]|nr:hypothetical protein [Bacteroidota bacterium]
MNIKLYQLPGQLKKLLFVFIFVLSIGVFTGLIHLYLSTNMSPSGAVERYNGSDVEDDFEIPENYPVSIEELLITTHSHIIMLSIIFFIAGFIFYFNSIIDGKFKLFLMIEPILSVLFSFGGIWLFRFYDETFVLLSVVSAALMYLSYYFMISIILFELIRKHS